MSSNIDKETEREAINLISSLKTKNHLLSEDLKKKDFIIKLKDERISQLENRLKKAGPSSPSADKYKSNNNNLTTNASTNNEKIYTDNENIRLLTENDSKMKSQLFVKDKIISELEHKIKDLEKELNTLKLQTLDKNETSFSQQHDLQRNKLNTYNRMLGESDGRLTQLTNEKAILEQKLNQLVEIIKNQSQELKVININYTNRNFKIL